MFVRQTVPKVNSNIAKLVTKIFIYYINS